MRSFVLQSDAVPETWQFLNGLRRDDLIAELLQNELDAGSTCTRIRFDSDKLICDGNGDPIDSDGWTRLKFFRGAGDRAPQKRAKTGVKNHGLKACFTIGDDICIYSAGKFTQQTLRDPSRAPSPYPGAMQAPENDPTAPQKGCRLEVPYRTSDLHTDKGEPLTFPAVSSDDVDKLFEAACSELPKRFLGVVRPDLRPRYEVEISHWKHGTKRFLFTASAGSRLSDGLHTKTCQVIGHDEVIESTIREQAHLVPLPIEMAKSHDIPEFYAARRGYFFAEVSWRVDQRGKPVNEPGQLRYPIAYVGSSPESSSGVCASYSAPFVSDTERHGISQQDLNKEIIRHCDEALVRLFRDVLLRRHGPAVLSMVCNDNIEPERRKAFLELLLRHRCIPIVGKPRRGAKTRLLCDSRSSKENWSFVVPCFTFNRAKVSEHLAHTCPAMHLQLHPQTPSEVIRDFANSRLDDEALSDNEHSPYTLFDETDVVSLLQGDADGVEFPWNEEWASQFASVRQAITLLDVLNEIEKTEEPLDDSDREKIKKVWTLPNDGGSRTPLGNLFCTRKLTDFPPDVDHPALIHRDLRDHPLFRRKNWKLPSFDLAEMCRRANLDSQPEPVRKRFWQWTKSSWSEISSTDRRDFAVLPIWPTVDGCHVVLGELCYPTRREVREILASVLRIPVPEVLCLSGVKRGGRGALGIRSTISPDDVAAWFAQRTQNFAPGKKLSNSELVEFSKFEGETADLAKDRDLASLLRKFESKALGLNHCGVLQPSTELHRETDTIRTLELRPEDLILRPRKKLDEIFGTRAEPSMSALRRALEHPPANVSVWRFRLAKFVSAAKHENKPTLIDDVPCVLEDEKWWKPKELALSGKSGNFWGDWKKPIALKGKSADEQEILRMIGVATAEPTPELSRGFFEWLRLLKPAQVEQHLKQVVRHFEHRNGVLSWWNDAPQIPCLPVQKGKELRLVSLADAGRRNSRVFIDDFPELSKEIRNVGSNISFVFDRPTELEVSIVDRIRGINLNRLSRIAGAPHNVHGFGGGNTDPELEQLLRHLKSPKLKREMPSRLALFDIETKCLRPDWFKRILRIDRISVCSKVVSTYRVRQRKYDVSVPSQFDETSGTLFVVKRENRERSAFFDAVSAFIFAPDASRKDKAVFENLVLAELPSREVKNPESVDLPDEDDSVEGESSVDATEEIGESQITHGTETLGIEHNIPQPIPLSEDESSISPSKGRDRSKARPRPSSALEDKHKQQLKKTYAWHCQICLATNTPQQLAPEGSYVSLAENRRCFIDAHHLDQVHAGGARHGGNLLVICKAHHAEYGDAIPRAGISAALQTSAKECEVDFVSADSGETIKLPGVIVDVTIPTNGTTMPLFFANLHRDFWLSHVEKPATNSELAKVH